MEWREIDGWFTDQDAALYRKWAAECPSDCTIVELGTWLGRSATCLLQALTAESKLRVRLVCVDCFPRYTLPSAAANLLPYHGRVSLIQWDTCKAAGLFADRSVWGVYIDADHGYEGTAAAIAAWRDRIARGGRIGGHDYQPPCPASRGWPGVVRAVDEAFPSVRLYGTSWEVPV